MNIILEDIFGRYDGFIYKAKEPTNTVVEDQGINDAPFVVKPLIKGKSVSHPAYRVWQSMLNRCYNSKFKNKNISYIGVTCCEEWLLFTNFSKWFKDNYKLGWQLDKDLILKLNKVYSPKTCLFVPLNINVFLATKVLNKKQSTPLGVYVSRNKFVSRINNGHGCTVHLGSFNTKEQAHQAWQRAKLEQAIAFNFPPLQRVIDQLKFEIENNLETKSL